MDEPGGHYAKWNKPETEIQILYNLIYMWSLKKLNPYNQSTTVVNRGWGWESWFINWSLYSEGKERQKEEEGHADW